jgi:hypothetical protein
MGRRGKPSSEYTTHLPHCARQFPTPGILFLTAMLLILASPGLAQSPSSMPSQFMISEYRVHGAHSLTPLEIETAVYPYLGPGRTREDIQAGLPRQGLWGRLRPVFPSG